MEVFDDVSTAGRVTRSLRKRLTSVDSNDAGSRPTTPQLTKLTSIAESSSSPSRSSRMTRRNSTTGNGTPSKALLKSKTSTLTETPEALNSPAKRTTRRSSISALNTPKKANQEDEDKINTPKQMPAKRVTRFQSKSPPQPEADKKTVHVSPKKNKAGPKSRRNKHLNNDSDSDVEVINLEENNEDESNNIIPIVGPIAEKTPKKLQIKLKAINENVEIIDLSDETMEIDDVENSTNVNLHMENIDAKHTNEALKSTAKDETNVESLHTFPICDMGDLNTLQTNFPRTDDKEQNNKEILCTSEDTVYPQSTDDKDLKDDNIPTSGDKCETPVNNNSFNSKKDNAEDTPKKVSSQAVPKILLLTDDKEKKESVSLQNDSTKSQEPLKVNDCEENNVESMQTDFINLLTNVTDNIQTAQSNTPLTDSNKNINTDEMNDGNEEILHLEFFEDDEALKGDDILRTPEKLSSPSNSSPVESVVSNVFSPKTADKREETPKIMSPRLETLEAVNLLDNVLENEEETINETVNLKQDKINRAEESIKPSENSNNVKSLDAKKLNTLDYDAPILNSTLQLSANDELKLGTGIKSPDKYLSPPKNTTNAPLVESVIMLQKLSPKVIARLCNDNNILSPKASKSVTFPNNNLDDDDDVKTSYPKTPASIRSKTYISKDFLKSCEDSSFSNNKTSLFSFRNVSAHAEEFQGHEESKSNANQTEEYVSINVPSEDNCGVEVEIIKDRTPLKLKNPTVLQSSTPVCDSILPIKPEPGTNAKNGIDNSEKSEMESPKKSEDLNNTNNNRGEELNATNKIESTAIYEDEATKATSSSTQEQQIDVASVNEGNVQSNEKIISTNSADEKNETENSEQFSKSWTHHVSGCATADRKIDIITPNSSINKQHKVPDSENIPLVVKEKTPAKASERNKSYLEDEVSNDSFEKLEFIDDEAMEAPGDYQSGDSMDEDERKEMEENEVIVDGESIGSEDTLSDGSNEADDDEENASFVTSDTEESLLQYTDEDEHIEDATKKSNKKKRNSHILVTSESEEDADNSFNKNKKLTNRITNKQKKKLPNRRTCILASSESENEKEPTAKIKENECTVNSPKILEKPLNFNVTKMIDASTDDETNINETLPQEQKNTSRKTNAKKDDAKNRSVDCETENESENNAMTQSNAKTCNAELGATNINTSHHSKVSPKKEWRKSLLGSPKRITVREDKADIIDKSCKSDLSAMIAERKDTPKKKTEEVLNSSNEFVIASDAPTANGFDKNQQILKNDVYEFQECENGVPHSEYESSATDREDEEEDIEIPETQEIERPAEVYQKESAVSEELVEDIDAAINGSSNLKNVGLSVSFCQAKNKRNVKPCKSAHHRSFTVGVMNNETEKLEPFLGAEFSDSSQTNSIDFADSNDGQLERDELEKLEMLNHSNLQFPNFKGKRQSLAVYDAQGSEENACLKKTKRKSMQSSIKEKFNPSKSLIESIESRKRELDTIRAKKSRLSKSVCETLKQPESNSLAASNTTHSSDESGDNVAKSSSTKGNRNMFKNSKKDYRSILDRCDEILEAANRAKLEAKQNSKKSKVTLSKSKKSSIQKTSSEEETANRASFVTKDVKRLKDKSTVALEQALRASAKILMNEAGKTKKAKSPLQMHGDELIEKRLPTQILNSLSDEDSKSKPEKKKFNNKPRYTLLQRMNCASGEIVEETLTPKKKKRDVLKKIELPTGTVFEEPVTPTRKTNKNGFRESPITPRNLGFKVRNILTAGQDKVPELRGATHNAERKRKRKIVDTEHVLPKPQWSQSGVFLEEMLPNFNDKKRFKFHGANACGSVDNSSALNALNFKHSSIFRKNIPRESSHEVLQRKERQCISGRYY